MAEDAKINEGIMELLANARSTSSLEGRRYYFNGDLCQMATAKVMAESLGMEVGIEGGIPFVLSEENYNKVIEMTKE